MLLDQTMHIFEKFIDELKEAEPEKIDHFIKSAVSILEISTEALRTSPELREAFLKVHAEFLNYPESKEMIDKSIKAYEDFIVFNR